MSEWISVEDNVPSEYEPVICYVNEFDDTYYVTAGVMHECLGFYVFNYDGEPDTELRDVTHWMPLPEPPQ